MEECAKSMGQRSNYAAVSDALSMPRKEECASIRHGAKLKVKLCSSEGYLNLAGASRGVCKVKAKRYSSEGCTNRVVGSSLFESV